MAYCKLCNREFVDYQAWEQHVRNSSFHNVYCDECNRKFVNKDALEQHLANSMVHLTHKKAHEQHLATSTVHDNFHCKDCDEDIESEEALNHHLKTSPSNHENICIECDRAFGSEGALEDHADKVHWPAYLKNIPTVSCNRCNLTFISQEALKQHVKSSTQHFTCPSCPSIDLETKTALNTHRQQVHHYCLTCDVSFATRNLLEGHWDTSSKHVWCKRCKILLDSGSLLKEHKATSENHHLCSHCQPTLDFATEGLLSARYKETHTFCRPCGKYFPSKTEYRTHLRNSLNHPYCDRCKREFNSRTALDDHLMVSPNHNICTECNPEVDYPTSWDLDKHRETNHHFCDTCERYYGSHDALYKHYHDSPRHTLCGRCAKVYNHVDDYKRHVLRSTRHNVCSVCIPRQDFEEKTELDDHCAKHHALAISEQNLGVHGAPDMLAAYPNSKYETVAQNHRTHPRATTQTTTLEAHPTANCIDCAGCDRKFRAQSDFIRHLENEGCVYGLTCDRVRVTAVEYDDTLKWISSDLDIPFKCPTCAAQFHAMSDFLQHAEDDSCAESSEPGSYLHGFLCGLREQLGQLL